MESKHEYDTQVSSTYNDHAALEDNEQSAQANNHEDARDMRRLGNKQQLKRNFHSIAVLGVSSIIVQTWSGLMIGIAYPLINGGRGGTVWTFLATWAFQIPLVASLAEMTSMAPTAAGQYGWISEFAPESIQRPLSYVAGWLAALGWQGGIASGAYGVAGILTGMASLGSPSYNPEPWHVTLLMIATGLFAIGFNVFAAKRLPLFEGVILFCYVLGFFVTIIPLWILAPKVSTHDVFFSFDNYGGWATIGSACVIAQSATSGAFLGFDAAAHISEEVKSAATSVPRMMMFALALNGTLGFVMAITFCFVLQDVMKQIVQNPSPFPWMDVYATATNSTGWALGMAAFMVLIAFSSCINAVMAASRQVWSLARDDGVPHPQFFLKVHMVEGTPVPFRSMLVSVFILVIMALINLGSSKIISIIIGIGGGAIGSTYVIAIACVLWRRLFGRPLPPAKWSLGRLGVPFNAIAVAYQTMATVVGFFPVANNPGVEGMNWTVVVFGGVAILCSINYVVNARHKYRGPVVRIMKDE